ncbi:Hypothetical_protein [Hexamita inflata]|uniref:Hypothetical_protein n=1 Tax=Hexamita inflata TaxID=28002 RepID=A0AA86Q060_9EUKA|nr:Hypothetical protein HINF_LOCUS32065 [Hexamita inflata]
MNPLPWREVSTILSIIIKCTNIERISPKKKSKVIQVFVFVLDLMKGTREELNIWSKAQIKKYQLKVIQWQKIKHTTVNQELNQGGSYKMENSQLIWIIPSVESGLTAEFNYNMTLYNIVETRPRLTTNCNIFHTRYLNILLIQVKTSFTYQTQQ